MNGIEILMDFSIIGFFLLVGTIVRSKVRFFQRFVIPASVIGGLIGLIFSPNGFGVLTLSDNLGLYAATMFNIVFAGVFIGRRIPGIGNILRNAGAQYGFAVINGCGQMAIGMFVVALFGIIGYSLHSTFGLMLLAGFQGGPGVPTAVAPMFEKLGWTAQEAAAVGETCAIAGLVLSILIGIVLINMGIVRNYTAKKFSQKGDEIESPTFKPTEKRGSIGVEITNSEALSTLAYCFSFIGLAIIIGYVIHYGVITSVPMLKFIPLFPFTLIGGMIVQLLIQILKLDAYVDHDTVNILGSFVLDVIIVASLMAMDIGVILTFGLPLVVMIALGVVFNLWWTLWLGPKMLPGAWFEKSVVEFGQATGATPQALLLLKMADPGMESGAVSPFVLKMFLFVPTVNVIPILLAPAIAAKGAPFFLGIFLAAVVVVFILMRIFSWHRRPEVNWSRPA